MPRTPRQRALWKTVLSWVGGVIAGLIVLATAGVFVLLRSRVVHEYVLRVAQVKASAALGTRVSLRDFELHFSGISPVLDLYDVAIAGAPPLSSPPLAHARRLHVAMTVTSLLHRNWYIEDIDLVQPIVHMQVNADGNANLPQLESSGGKNNTNVFNLGVRHASIEDGSVFYNDRKAALSADLNQLTFSSTYDPSQTAYSGHIGYRNGHLLMRNLAPVPHELDAEFVATPETFTLRRAVLRSGNSNVELSANVRDYSNPQIEAHYSANVDSGQFRRILRNEMLPSGVVRADGTVTYRNHANRPFLDLVNVNGTLGSKLLLVTTSSLRENMSDIAATYKLANGNLLVRDVRARLLGGELTASFSTRDLTGKSRSHLSAQLHSVSLKSAQTLADVQAARQLGVSGAMSATVDATWGNTLDDLLARADATARGQIAGKGSSNSVPVTASLHARYVAARKQLDLENSYLRAPQTVLTMNGSVSEQSSLQVNLAANDLRELESIAAVVRPGTPALGLYGMASLNASVSGPTDAPEVVAQLHSTDLRVRGTAWRLVRMSARLNPARVILQNGELDPANRGHITFGLEAGLNHWAFSDTSPIKFSLSARQIDIEEITHGVGMQMPVSGTLAAAISMQGSEQNPVGNGHVSLTNAKIEDEPVKSATLQFNGTGENLVATLDAYLPAGAANAQVTFRPKERAYEARIQANGIQLEQLQTVKQRNMPLSGVMNLNAEGKGTFDNPGLDATLEVPQLTMRGQKISGIKLQTSVADHIGTFDLSSKAVDTSISGHGTVRLTGDYDTDARLDTQVIPLQPLIAAYAPQAENVSGQTELHATIRGPLRRKDLLEAHITLPQLALNYRNSVQIAASGPIRAEYVNGVLQVPRNALRGTGTDLEFQATVPLTTNAPASMLLRGSVDLQLAQVFDPDIVSSGQVRFDIDSYGNRSDPNVRGEVRVVNANLSTETVPLSLQNGNGTLTLLSDRLQITQFYGTVGGGDFSASGAVAYRPTMRLDVALASKDTRMLYENIRGAFNTKLALTGSMDSALLQGQVNVEQLQFTPAFDLMDLMGELGGGVSTPPPVGGFEQALRLSIGINSAGGVSLVSRTMSLQAAANLRLTGTAAQPVLLGRVNLNGGDLIFRGNRFVLQGGTINFVNPSQTIPEVNFAVSTQVQQYNVQMHFRGPADHLQTSYSSDPALPPSDIINLIAFGQTPSAANPNPLGNLAAEQFVASQVSGQITSRVEKVAGLSQLSVDPLLGTNQNESPGARITVQQRVTGKFFVTFSADTTSTQNSVIKLEFQQTPRVSYSGTRDQNGGFGFDRRIRKEW